MSSNKDFKFSNDHKYFTFLKNLERVPDTMDLLELKIDLQFNESQSSIRNAKCQICSNIVTNPKMCGECEVLYCGNCASHLILNSKVESTNCRNCSEILNLRPLSKSLQRILDDFHMRCPSMNDNCPPPVLYKNLISHLEECKYWSGFSKCLGCGLVGKTHSIEEHVSVCQFAYFKCEPCNNIVKRKDLQIHEETCKKINPNCDLCKVLRTKLDDIEEKMISKINNLENIIDFQQKSILIIFIINFLLIYFLEYNQLNERVTEMENSNAIFDAQMQNKEFKAAVLNQLEEMSNKNSYEFKNIKSKFLI